MRIAIFLLVGIMLSPALLSCHNSSSVDTKSSCSPQPGTLPSSSTAVPGAPIAVALIGCTTIDYSMPANIGGQAGINMIVDSGSTVLAVAGSNCVNCSGVSPVYVATHGKNLCKSLISTYGDGTGWIAPVFQDTVKVGTLPSIVMNFGSMSEQLQSPNSGTWFFNSFDCNMGASAVNQTQGIFGLAFPGLSSAPAVGYLDALQAQASVPDVYATQLCMSGGQIWFGGYDTNFASTAPVYTPISPPLGQEDTFFWIKINDLKVGNTSIGRPANAYTMPLVDSGTSIALLPPTVFTALQTAIGSNAAFRALVGAPNANSWFANGGCFTTSQTQAQLDAALPTLTMVLPSTTIGQTISVVMPATMSYLDYHKDGSNVIHYCAGFAPNSSSSDPTIIGGTFLRSLITIFDRTGGRVGFATGTGCSS